MKGLPSACFAIGLLSTRFCFSQNQGKPLYSNDHFAVYADSVVQDKFLAKALSDTELYSNYQSLSKKERNTDSSYHTWILSKDISAFPQYRSAYPLADVLYNMSLQEMMNAVEADSTFRTGKEWAGVWTRDISYSIILSMAFLQPRVAKFSLLRKVDKNGKIIQDTGTGGAWPISTDRIIWAVAAWELYKVTGDMDWLRHAYTIIRKTIEADYQNIYDQETGLVKGESSFLDWREQTYPAWMQPADIFESECLGTNAVHFEANRVLSKMALLLNKKKDALHFQQHADRIKMAINRHLWIDGKNYYGQFLYGRLNKILSPRSEALGESLCILFDIADSNRRKQILASAPITPFGISCIYPQIPDIPPYHNNAVWPFVQAFWMWAGAKGSNEESVTQSICDIYRPSSMFLTNKENFVAENGDYSGTQINSSNMLWSLSGNLSIVYKLLFGMRFNENNLSFQPFVPRAFAGDRSLTNLKYRNAFLSIEMNGYGNVIRSFMLDGKKKNEASIPADLEGTHTIKIELADNLFPPGRTSNVRNSFSPSAPQVEYHAPLLSWKPVENAIRYSILKNGKPWKTTGRTSVIADTSGFDEYIVIASDKNASASFGSEPVIVTNKNSRIHIYQAEKYNSMSGAKYSGFTGEGFTELSTTTNKSITIPVQAEKDGEYAIDCRYANGNGPINTENKCALRAVWVDERRVGIFVFPQRGTNQWENWGFSNLLKVRLTKGMHRVSIKYLAVNENMNININQAMIDYIRVSRL